jgi:hypothetical protein
VGGEAGWWVVHDIIVKCKVRTGKCWHTASLIVLVCKKRCFGHTGYCYRLEEQSETIQLNEKLCTACSFRMIPEHLATAVFRQQQGN